MKLKSYLKSNRKMTVVSFVAIFFMGLSISFLILCNLGTDTCVFMNTNVAAKIGTSFGNWQLIFNIFFLILMIIFRRDLIGIGTIINMVLIGYYADFFDWIWAKTIPDSVFTEPFSRYTIFALALIGFIISAAMYMNANVGIAPYDAISVMFNGIFKKLPYFICRIIIDSTCIFVGMAVGGKPLIGNILMALLLGPTISIVGKKFNNGKIGDKHEEIQA